MNPLIQFRVATAVSIIGLGLACFAVLPATQAGLSPTPDGLYPGANVAEGGAGALGSLTTGSNNTAVGAQTLFSLTTGIQNTAVGAQALKDNTAEQNTATGFQALVKNTSGAVNTAIGWRALFQNTEGGGNTAVGAAAGGGSPGITTGSNNTVVGNEAGQSIGAGSQNIYIGEEVDPGISENGTIRIGDSFLPTLGATSTCFIAGISGRSVGPMSAPVHINAGGQLGTPSSSARFKKDIESMGKSSEVLYSLRPVTFHYKGDETNTPCSGLIAEEVAKVDPTLILLDKEGKPQTVRYEQINAMLLNEFLKEHQKVQRLEAALAAMDERLKEQETKIEKVNAKVELNKPAPQTVLNNH